MKARGRRTLAVPVAAVWETVGDTARIARWWPRVVRVESPSDHSFTEVLVSKRGREVRADFRVGAHVRRRRIAWALEIEGSPFQRVFSKSEYDLTLKEAGDGSSTEVRIEHHLLMRGANRVGAVFAYRSARRTLREALAALEEEVSGT